MKRRKKKGATFLEVIISVAIIAILVIPISDLIMSSVRNNRRAKDEQNAKLLGQRISEGIKKSDIDLSSSRITIHNGTDKGKDNNTIVSADYENIEINVDPTNANRYEATGIDIGKGMISNITLEKRTDMPSDNVPPTMNWDAIMSLDYNSTDGSIYIRLVSANGYTDVTAHNYRLIGDEIVVDNTEGIVYIGFSYLNRNDGTTVNNIRNLPDGSTVRDVINFNRNKINDFYDGDGNLLTTATGYVKFIIDDNIPQNRIENLKIKVNNRRENAPITINAEGNERDLYSEEDPSEDNQLITNISEAYDEFKINRYYSRRALNRDERVGTAYNYKIEIYNNGKTIYKDSGIKNIK